MEVIKLKGKRAENVVFKNKVIAKNCEFIDCIFQYEYEVMSCIFERCTFYNPCTGINCDFTDCIFGKEVIKNE